MLLVNFTFSLNAFEMQETLISRVKVIFYEWLINIENYFILMNENILCFCAVKHSAHYKSFKTLVLGAKWEAIDSFQNY